MLTYYSIFGIVGLLLISVGIIMHKRSRQDIVYILGGLSLLVYSASIGDWVFITLQIIFIFAALYDLQKWVRHKGKKHKK